jgi:protease-4
LWFWRIVALIAIVLVIAGFFGDDGPDGPYIARYELQGVIFDDPLRDDLMAEIADNEDIEALVLRINSPGGTTAGSEALYESLRRVAESKRVVAVLGEVAASGGYIAAISADHIVARGNTLTGSIGVIAQPFSKPTPDVIAAEEALVEDGYQWFRGLVGERHTLDDAALDVVADGRVFSGRQAVANGLVDQIGGETAAIAWLNEQGVESGLPVEDVFVEREDKGLFGFGDSWFLSQITGRARPSHGGLTLLSILK